LVLFWGRHLNSRVFLLPALGLLLVCVAQPLRADVYQTPQAFVSESGGRVDAPQFLWLNAESKSAIQQILGRNYPTLRIKYWQSADATLWVLDDIGKDEYITLGFIIRNQSIERSKVLIFRESRGWEIKFPSFAQRVAGARLTDQLLLDRKVDGITGATLSVQAYERMARLALFLDKTVHAQNQ